MSSLIQAAKDGHYLSIQENSRMNDIEGFHLSPETILAPSNVANELEIPPKSTTLLRASSEMSIEAMLQWPVFKRSLREQSTQRETLVGDNQFGQEVRERGAVLDESMMQLEVIEPLVESFIANNLPCNPILDPVSLRQQVDALLKEGLSWNGQSCLLVSSNLGFHKGSVLN